MTPRIQGPLAALALAWLALAAAPPAGAAQDTLRLGAGGERDGPEPDARRVVELEAGGFLRGRTRRTEAGVWQAFAKGGWHDLAGVERATLERTLLGQAEDLAKKTEGEPVRRVALADWMAHQGLTAEALEELDRVLREDPGQADALRWLAAAPSQLGVHVPQVSAEELLGEAAGAPPALRELCLGRMAEIESPAVLFERYRAALSSPVQGLRAVAARGLGRQFPGEALDGLCVRSVLDGSDEVRAQAALALGQAGEPAVIVPLVRALSSKHGAVRTNAIEALGRAGYPAAVEPLVGHLANLQAGGGGRAPAANVFVGSQMAFVQDFDVEVASGAAVADPQVSVLSEGSVLDVRVQGIAVHSTRGECQRLRAALGRLTGARPGDTNSAWLDWWQQNGGDWR